MRRNNNMNRGAKFGNTSGPLLTNHLRDLDMELALLKRKRELFEQEQNILNRFSNNNKRQFDNKQPFYTFNQPTARPFFNVDSDSNTFEFDNSYNPRPQRNKRQSNTPWQNQNPPPPKRFNDQNRINPWVVPEPRPDYRPVQNFNLPQSKIFPGPIKALMDLKPSIGQRTKKYVPPPRKNFNPTKVTKPKNKNVTQQLKKNNGNTKPIPQIAKPVAKERTPEPVKRTVQFNILRPNKAPSVQMKGRLELALGNIVKCVKERCLDPITLEYFMIPFIQRVIKHTIRLRIRDVMMNQYVESVSVIVDKYRQKYPMETDVELMRIAEDAQKFNDKNERVLQLIEADDPEEFFMKNVSKILSDKLDEAFHELKKIYQNKDYDFDKCVESFPKESDFSNDVQIQEDNEVVMMDDSQYSVQSEKDKNKSSVVCSADVKTITQQLEEKSANTKKYVEFMDKIIENRLPKILPRYKDMLMSILCIDKEFLSLKAFVTNNIKHKLRKSMETEGKVVTVDDEDNREKAPSSEPASGTTYANFNQGKPVQETAAITEKPMPSTSTNNIETSEKTEETVSSIVTSDVSKIVTSLAKPSPTTIPSPTAISSTPAKSSPIAEQVPSKPVLPKKVLNQTVPTTPTKVAEKTIPSVPKSPALKDIQYIKFIGRPHLPARNDIYDFLNKYKPTSIKKHKAINNLLVVGFSDKEAFENILKANETVVGDATIIIKASEQVNNSPVQKANEQVKEIAALKNPNEQETNINESETGKSIETDKAESPNTADKINTSNEILSSDLDTQITDLLSSIRQADEENGTSTSDEQMDATDTKEEKNMLKEENGDMNIKEIPEKELKIDDKELPAIDNSDNIASKPAKELETIREIDDDGASAEAKPNIVEEIAKTNLKESGRATPTRSSSRLAVITPSTIKTRRASRLASNN